MGEPVGLFGAAPCALPIAPFAPDFGVFVADWLAVLGESADFEDWPSFGAALDAGFLPSFVGVLGGSALPLPAAGDGAMLLDVRPVCGEEEGCLGVDFRALGVGV